MRDFAFEFGDGGVSINWSTTVDGINNVKQKLINNMMTDRGTDEIVSTRGTDLLRAVTGGGIYDLRSAQHAVNFAALSAKNTVRAWEEGNAPPTERVADFTSIISAVEGRTIITDLTITTKDGSVIGTPQQII